MKTEPQTNLEKAEELLYDWIVSSGGFNNSITTEDMAALAAYCLDEREKETGWKPYPENKPGKEGEYNVKTEGSDQILVMTVMNHIDYEFFWARECVTDFCPIPEFIKTNPEP